MAIIADSCKNAVEYLVVTAEVSTADCLQTSIDRQIIKTINANMPTRVYEIEPSPADQMLAVKINRLFQGDAVNSINKIRLSALAVLAGIGALSSSPGPANASRKRRAAAKAPNTNDLRLPGNEPPVTGRNQPCPCGSGQKYKKCCRGKRIGANDEKTS